MVQSNVVPIGDHPKARTRLSPQESASVLSGCRELALDRMARALSGMLDRVEDELFDLAEKALDREAQNVFLDARSQARGKRALIEGTFRRHFVEFFNRKVRGEGAAPPRGLASGEMTLVAHEDLEESLAVSEMSRKLGVACESELYALGQRMGFLLERPDLEPDANPLSPATVFAALKDACDQIESDFKVRLALLRQLERHAEVELRSVYHDLNTHLVERRILPEIRFAARRAPNSPVRRDAPPPAAPGAAPAAAAAGAGAPVEPDLFATLAQLLRTAAAPALPAAGPVAMPSGAGAQAGFAMPGNAAPGSAVPGNVMAGNAMPGSFGAGSAGGAPAGTGAAVAEAASSRAFVTELTRLHRESPQASGEGGVFVNVVKDFKASEGGTLAALDAMTIDLVAMLFDFVFEDDHIPDAVKAQLGRLQIPTLKVALLDKGFFSARSHPARRLIDLLAEAAIGLDHASAASTSSLAMIEGVVGEILRDFDTDLALFEAMVARVQAFLEEQKDTEADIVQRSARVIEARERDEIARLVAEEEVGRRLAARVWVPMPVRQMLLKHWTGAFASVQLAEGEGSPAWQSLVYSMDDLLWSVEPKANADERKRLVAMLPGLLRQVQYGLRRAGMADAERDAFLSELVDCHANAVKAGLRGIAAVPDLPPPAPVANEPVIERELLPAGDLQVEEIRLKSPRGSAVRNVFTRTGIWTNLQRGTWVEFRRAAAALRARLTWISPNKGVYLFTNPSSGDHAVSISPEALAEQMRLGEARIIDDASLVDRAVDSIFATLRKAQDAPQG